MERYKHNAFYTFGELVQGFYREEPFLVSLPINQTVTVTFIKKEIGPLIIPKEKEKVATLVAQWERQAGQKVVGELRFQSSLPAAKGFASSSADLVATLRCLSEAYACNIPEEDIAQLLCRVEPTDPIFIDEFVLFQQTTGKIIRRLGKTLPFTIIGIDDGGTVDTNAYHRLMCEKRHHHAKEMEELFHLIQKGITEQNIPIIFEATRKSASLNQMFLPKKHFLFFYELAIMYDVGLVIAHSGSLIGLLIRSNDPRIKEVVTMIEKSIRQKVLYFTLPQIYEK
ncbi:GHMP family kinase ATP-binding protein [Massilibacterium senegalense]|uniref:GHMP family kinase ATP-binding protein n=1 Tax=Massilibacterium senegalense TaxID=1632858 RepID=UPI0007830A3D|nr:hypothetical protein [Massilibacterium senegalense]